MKKELTVNLEWSVVRSELKELWKEQSEESPELLFLVEKFIIKEAQENGKKDLPDYFRDVAIEIVKQKLYQHKDNKNFKAYLSAQDTEDVKVIPDNKGIKFIFTYEEQKGIMLKYNSLDQIADEASFLKAIGFDTSINIYNICKKWYVDMEEKPNISVNELLGTPWSKDDLILNEVYRTVTIKNF